MNQQSPLQRDRARTRVRLVTGATAAGAGLLALGGAVVAAGTFGGRTVGAHQTTVTETTPTPDASGLQQPLQNPGDGAGVSSGSVQRGVPVTSGSS